MKWKAFNFGVFFLGIGLFFTCGMAAGDVFRGMDIELRPDGKRVFEVGITQTNTGHNFIPLKGNVKTSKIDLSRFGYYGVLPDKMINNHLSLSIENNTNEKFKIQFSYEKGAKKLSYRIQRGIVKIDEGTRDALLIIREQEGIEGGSKKFYLALNSAMPEIKRIDLLYKEARYGFTWDTKGRKGHVTMPDTKVSGTNLSLLVNETFRYDCSIEEDRIIFQDKPYMFFDFNHQNSYLEDFYPKIKKISDKTEYYPYFYYYGSDDYDIYTLNFYQEFSDVDISVMGLSEEDPEVEYYRGIVEGIVQSFGKSFTNHKVYIVSRYGSNISAKLEKAIKSTGIKAKVIFRSYSDL